MSRVLIVGLILLAVLLPLSASAAGKSTVDPNAGGSNVSATMLSGAGLAQRVTYEGRRKTVLSVLTDLSKMTGVTLKAGYNNEDWQVRDRRMNIFAKDIPLTNLMDSIARVMEFQWIKHETDGVVSYRLYMDRQILLGAERQRLIEEEKLEKRKTEARQRLVSGLEKADGMSADDLRILREQSPYIYLLARQGWARTLTGLFAEVPAAKRAWNAGEELTVDLSSLSLGLREAFGKIWQRSETPTEGSVVINNMQRSLGYDRGSRCVGYVGLKTQSSLSCDGFPDPDNEISKIAGRAAADEMDAGTREDKIAIMSKLDQDIRRAEADAPKNKDLCEPLNEHSDDPALSVNVKMNAVRISFADVLAELATSSSFAVVSDSFEDEFWNLSFSTGETKVRAVLDTLETVCRYNWEKHGSVIELHDRDWFRKRSAQIPEAWLESWRKALKANKLLDLGELSQIAQLTTEQFWANVRPDKVLGNLGIEFAIAENADILNLYGRLDKQQRALIFTTTGLSLDLVNIDQSLQWTQAGSRLVGIREKHGKQTTYTFSVVTLSGGTNGIQRKIECPMYIPPAKEKPKDEKSQPAGQKSLKQ